MSPPVGQWLLGSDDDGYGYIVDDGNSDSAPLTIDELLSIGVWGSAQVVLLDNQMAAQPGAVMPRADAQGRSLDINLHIPPVPGGDRQRGLTVVVFDLPKSGSRVYVSMKDLYGALGMTAFGGKSYLWIDHLLSRWEKRFDAFRMAAQVLRSKPFKTNNLPSELHDHRSLDFVSVSLVGLLALLAPWAYQASRQLGGLGDPDR